MSIARKLTAVLDTIRAEKYRGLARVIAQSTADYLALKSLSSIYDDSLLYRYGSCNDLLTLKSKYFKVCYDYDQPSSHGWGLKQLGTLFCLEKYNQIKPNKVLEVGAGYNTFFDENIGCFAKYWMIDDIGFYDESKFNNALSARKNTKFIKGLLGSYSSELPENYFDFIFSISVLEHVPFKQLNDVYSDMFRILSPGGIIVHSIDGSSIRKAQQDFIFLKKAGFTLTFSPDMSKYLSGKNTTLFEPVDIVFKYYGGIKENMWDDPRNYNGHSATMLVVAKK